MLDEDRELYLGAGGGASSKTHAEVVGPVPFLGSKLQRPFLPIDPEKAEYLVWTMDKERP